MRIVGVAGGSCSGKTFLTRALEARLGSALSSMKLDSYYRDIENASPEERASFNYDEPAAFDVELLRRDLDALRAGACIRPPRYSYVSHRREGLEDAIAPSDFVILEGILVLAIPQIRKRLSDGVFVACPAQTRLARRLERDTGPERARDPDDVRRQFREHVAPMHDLHIEPSKRFADLLVDGQEPIEALVARVETFLLGRS